MNLCDRWFSGRTFIYTVGKAALTWSSWNSNEITWRISDDLVFYAVLSISYIFFFIHFDYFIFDEKRSLVDDKEKNLYIRFLF